MDDVNVIVKYWVRVASTVVEYTLKYNMSSNLNCILILKIVSGNNLVHLYRDKTSMYIENLSPIFDQKIR